MRDVDVTMFAATIAETQRRYDLMQIDIYEKRRQHQIAIREFFEKHDRPKGIFSRFFELVAAIAAGISTNAAQVKRLRESFDTFQKEQKTMSDALLQIKAAQASIVAAISAVSLKQGEIADDLDRVSAANLSLARSQTEIAVDQQRMAADLRLLATKLQTPGGVSEEELATVGQGLADAASGLESTSAKLSASAATLDEGANQLAATSESLAAGAESLDGSANALHELAIGPPVETETPLTLVSISPAGGNAGDGNTEITLIGTGFDDTSRVSFGKGDDRTELVTTLISDTELRATIPAAELAEVGEFEVFIGEPDEHSATLFFSVVTHPADISPSSFG